MDLNANDFEILGLPLRFAQNEEDIENRWRALQRQVHPDRFVAQGTSAHAMALQYSGRVNEARARLKDPLQRAAYLCALQGFPVAADGQTQNPTQNPKQSPMATTTAQAMPAEFLFRQMAMHEALEAAQTPGQVKTLGQEITGLQAQSLARCGQLIDEDADYTQAAQEVRALFFYQRLLGQVQSRLQSLLQSPEGPSSPTPLPVTQPNSP